MICRGREARESHRTRDEGRMCTVRWGLRVICESRQRGPDAKNVTTQFGVWQRIQILSLEAWLNCKKTFSPSQEHHG